MFCYKSKSHLAEFNLATEEFLLKNFNDDIFMLYKNAPSLIVGKHQNTLAEINIDIVKQQNIPVVRRLSGGGTVYHDLGNLNFCFITKGERGKFADSGKFTCLIQDALHKLGVKVQRQKRNDLTLSGMKISGNATHIFRDRVIHHGTLLFSSNLKRLKQLLKANYHKFKDKGIRSVSGKVTNISHHLQYPIPFEEFSNIIWDHIYKSNENSKILKLTEHDISRIQELSESKYSTWEWCYGYSPQYIYNNTIQISGCETLKTYLKVEKGIIREIDISGSCLKQPNLRDLQNRLRNIPHKEECIMQAASKFDLTRYLKGVNNEMFIKSLF